MQGDHWVYRITFLFLFCLLFSGCSPRQAVISQEERNLAQLSRLYGLYISKNRGQPPPSMEELKRFASSSSKEDLFSRGVTAEDLNAIFFSSRDEQEFVYLRPQSSVGPVGFGVESVVFYEKIGAAGNRYVGFTTPGRVDKVNDLRFKELVPDAD